MAGGGFPEPILIRLCTLGHAARAVFGTCVGGEPDCFKALKLRFASPVLPGQTLLTEMWKEDGGGREVFVCKVKETGKTGLAISNALMELDLHKTAKL